MKTRTNIKLLILALVLTFLLLLTACLSMEEDEFEIDSEGSLIKYNGSGGSITIPKSVTAIGSEAFFGRIDLTGVSIPDSVTEIGSYAFGNCISLISMKIPDSVTYIDNYAFAGCANLASITIPSNVAFIGIGAFEGCKKLSSITLPDSITEISNYTFFGCTNLTSIAIPSGVANIGSYSFYNCRNLTDVSLSSGVTSINKWAFANCPKLTEVAIPKSVSEIENYTFYNIANLTLYGVVGSYVEAYAKEHNIAFSAAILSDYLYETSDIAESIALPVGELTAVTDESSAVTALSAAIARVSPEQRLSAAGIDLLTLYAEEAIAQAASSTVTSDEIFINELSLWHMQLQAEQVKAAAEKVFISLGITTVRDMRKTVKFMSEETERVTIVIEPSARNTTADKMKVETPDYSVSFQREFFEEDLNNGSLVITIEEVILPLIEFSEIALPLSEFPTGELPANTDTNGSHSTAGEAEYLKTYKITINEDITQNCTFSFKPISDANLDYQVVVSIGQAGEDAVLVSKYNPVTGMIETKLNTSGVYSVQENRKSFDDLADNVGNVKEVIEKLASKGVINGISNTIFSPSSLITRAELTALIMRLLSKVDNNPANNFADVDQDMWSFTAINSAKKYGIINGTSNTTFEPDGVMRKDQIVAVIARTLRSEMSYKPNTANNGKYLQNFTDKDDLEEVYIEDIVFAEREGLVVARKDGRFNPTEDMTRMDAAMLLDRLLERLW